MKDKTPLLTGLIAVFVTVIMLIGVYQAFTNENFSFTGYIFPSLVIVSILVFMASFIKKM